MSMRGSQEDGSEISFTSNTQQLRLDLILHIKKCQGGLTAEVAMEEEKSIINLFKKALFAKDSKVQNEGKRNFIDQLKTIRERQAVFEARGENLLTARTITKNLSVSEKPFLDHLQENVKAQSQLKK